MTGYDVNATDGTVRKKPYQPPDAAEKEPAKAAPRLAKLDRPEMVELHKRLLGDYMRELDISRENRFDQAKDEDVYDNIQWDETDAQVLRDRGQMPLVYNVTSASIDWITGTERRSRADFKVLPRRKDASKPAERKTQLLKYLSDVNRVPFTRSRAFEDAVKVGIGWLEDGIGGEDGEEPLYSRYENWRYVLHDSLANEPDLSDSRYLFRAKWVDLDIACAMFPKRKELLERSAAAADDILSLDLYGDEAMDQKEVELDRQGSQGRGDRIDRFTRRRVRLIEGWVRQPVTEKKVAGGDFAGEVYDPMSRGHRESIEAGEAATRQAMMLRMHVAIFTPVGMLWHSPSPYRHNRFPLTPIWGFRRGRDGQPYGLIRRLRDIQDDINKRASKALYILSTNKVIMDEDAVPDDTSVEEFIEEVNSPDGVIRKKKGSHLEINAERELSQWHLELMARSISMVERAAGVNDDNLGRKTNAQSGIAIQRRQEQGSMTTVKFFDNLMFASQIQGEKQLANVEQFMEERKAFRITNMRGSPEYIEVNDGLPENDIVRTKADFIISEGEWRASMRQAAVDELLQAMKNFPPEVVMVMLDLLVENMDLPNREEIVKRIRSVTGQRDPDAEEPTEEEVAQVQAKRQADEINVKTALANLQKLTAEAEKTLAQAKQIDAQTTVANIDALQKALTAAQSVIAIPATADVADHILDGSGFQAPPQQLPAPAGLRALPPPSPNPAGGPAGLMQ